MNIIFVLESFFPKNKAGTEIYVLNLSKKLIENKYKVSVIISNVGLNSREYEYEGIKVFSISVPQKISAAEMNGLVKSSNLIEFKEILNKIKPDVIHFHSYSRSFNQNHIKVAHESGAKVFFTPHLMGVFCVRNDLKFLGKKSCNGKVNNFKCSMCFASTKYNLKKSFLGAMVTVFVSNTFLKKYFPALKLIKNKKQGLKTLNKYTNKTIAIAKWIDSLFKVNNINNSIVISQAINTDVFSPILNEHKHAKLVLGYVGRISKIKGIHLLIAALKKNNLFENFDLYVATFKSNADDNYFKKIKYQYLELGYNNWYEDLNSEQLNELYNKFDYIVIPSLSEVAPLVVLEAFAKKIPVVVSNIIAFNENVINNFNGLIFENDNIESLYKLLKKILQNKNLKIELQKNIKKSKSIEDLVKEHITLYLDTK